jgi:hypothetical protein
MTHPRQRKGIGRNRLSALLCAALLSLACGLHAARAQNAVFAPAPPLPAGTPESWVQTAVNHELAIVQDESHPMRYVIRVIDRKGDKTREVIESAQGNVARLIQRDGKPITAAEDAAERSRLNGILESPDEFLKHQRNDKTGRNYAVQVIKLLPQAGLYTYAPGQPQPQGVTSPQVVIDFRPNPNFHPPTLISEVLTGLDGRVWIDARSGTMTRIQGHVLRTVNFGWGVLARIYPGGHVELEQTCIEGKRCIYSHVDEDVTVREVMLHTVNDKTKISTWNFRLLPAPVSFQDAVHTLLAEQIPLQ